MKWQNWKLYLLWCYPILIIGSFPIFYWLDNFRTNRTVQEIATLSGLIAGGIAVFIAIMIYRFQAKDLNESLKNLAHMAFSMEEVDIKDIDNKVEKLFKGNITHLLIVSRFSAIPGFWLDYYHGDNRANSIMTKIEKAKIPNMLFIGPDDSKITSYTTEAMEFQATSGMPLNLDKNKIINDYNNRFGSFHINDKAIIHSTKVADMTVNAIMIKKEKPSEMYNSKYEVIFFGSSREVEDKIPEFFRIPIIYYTPVSLMARLWKFEIEQIIKSEITNSEQTQYTQWLNTFYKE